MSQATLPSVDQLIEEHREYVCKLAREIHRKLPGRAQFEDLVGYGEVGLIQAANKFDPEAGAAFTTFAYYRIRGAIFDGIRKMSWLPPRARKQAVAESAMDDIAASVQDVDPNDFEAVARQFHQAVDRLGAVLLITDLAGDEGDDGSLDPTDQDDPIEPLADREVRAEVGRAVAKLPEDQMRLIDLFYFQQRSMTDIADELGVHKATISRLHAKAITALQTALADVA